MNAAGSRHSHTFALEGSTYGAAITNPALKKIRLTGDTLKLVIDTLKSSEIIGDRQIHDAVNGARKVEGDISFEMSYGSHDELFEALLGGTWAPRATITAATISAAAADNSYNDSGNGFLTAGFRVGDKIAVVGFTGNVVNNITTGVLTAVAAGKLTLGGADGDVIVDDAAGESVTIVSLTQRLKAGSQFRSFLMERLFADIEVYNWFTGCVGTTLQLQISANAIVTGTVGIVGKDMTIGSDAISGSTYPAASTTAPNVSFRGVLKEGGVTTSAVTEAQISLDNNVDPQYVIGDPTGQIPVIGNSDCTGQITVFFTGPEMMTKFINGTESSLEFSFPDALGNTIGIILPRIKFNGAPADVKGDGLIPLVMPFQALYDATTGSNIILERTPA